jgi:hypothetical protein
VTGPARRIALVIAAAGCAALASCSGTAGSPATDGTAQSTPSAGSATTAPTDGGASAPAAASIDPCALLTPADGQAALHKPLGAGRKVSAGDLDECVYDSSGPLIVAVLRSSFTPESFARMIETQNTGPYAKTTGKAAAVAGLGDAAYSFDKAGIVEVLKNRTVLSITSATTATSKQIAQAALRLVP